MDYSYFLFIFSFPLCKFVGFFSLVRVSTHTPFSCQLFTPSTIFETMIYLSGSWAASLTDFFLFGLKILDSFCKNSKPLVHLNFGIQAIQAPWLFSGEANFLFVLSGNPVIRQLLVLQQRQTNSSFFLHRYAVNFSAFFYRVIFSDN